MKIGDIDVTNTLLNLEHDINVLQQILNYIASKNPQLNAPTGADILSFKNNAVQALKQKYPNMGIQKS